MNKQIIILLTIFLLSFTTAIYAGEKVVYSNDLGKTNLVWTIIENTSQITILPLVTIDASNITIQIPSDMPPQSFKLVFMEETTNTVVQTITFSSGSSGGHSTKKKIVNNTIIKEIEIPNYISVENKTIEVVNNTITKWNEIEKPTMWTWIFAFGFLALVIIICIIAYIWSNSIKRDIDERREENGERN